MRYFYEFRDEPQIFGKNVPSYNPLCREVTIFIVNGLGLCVTQERFDLYFKSIYFSGIDGCIANDFLKHPFGDIFNELAKPKEISVGYPVYSVRDIMWKLRMKPLRKEPWEVPYPNFNSRHLHT